MRNQANNYSNSVRILSEITWNFFLGLVISNSDICRRGQSAFTPVPNCTMAPKPSTVTILALTTIPGFTSEWVKTDPSIALVCLRREMTSKKIVVSHKITKRHYWISSFILFSNCPLFLIKTENAEKHKNVLIFKTG